MPTSGAPVQHAEASQNGSFASLAATFGSNPAAGHGILAIVWRVPGILVSSMSGCGATWTKAFSTPTTYVEVWVGHNASGSAKVVTANFSPNTAGTSMLLVQDWPGIDTVSAIDAWADVTGNSSNQTPASTVTPLFSNSSVVTALFAQTTSGNVAGGTAGGFTQYQSQNQGTQQVWATASYKVAAPGGSAYGTSWSLTVPGSNYAWEWIAIALKGAPAAAVTASVTFAGAGTGKATVIAGQAPPLWLEFRVFDGANPITSQLATIPGAREGQWHDPYNAMGAGSFVLAVSDARIASVAKNNLVRCYLGPFDVFQFWIETPGYTVASPAGPSGESVKIAGRSIESYLKRAVVYPTALSQYKQVPVPASGSPGAILRALITNAQNRGAIPLVICDFDDSVDSSGNAWTNTNLALQFTVGTDYLAVIDALRQQGIVVELRGDFTLHAWQSYGAHYESTVVLRAGKQIADAVTWTQPQVELATRVVVQGASGLFVEAADAGSETGAMGRREAFVDYSTGTTSADLTAVGTNEINARKLASSAISLPVLHSLDTPAGSPLGEPYRHYLPGDWVAVDIPGSFAKVSELVAAINIKASDVGAYAVDLDLNAVQPDILVRLAKKLATL